MRSCPICLFWRLRNNSRHNNRKPNRLTRDSTTRTTPADFLAGIIRETMRSDQNRRRAALAAVAARYLETLPVIPPALLLSLATRTQAPQVDCLAIQQAIPEAVADSLGTHQTIRYENVQKGIKMNYNDVIYKLWNNFKI